MQTSPRHGPPRVAPPDIPTSAKTPVMEIPSAGSTPATPSLSGSFDQVPQTPERTPGQVQPEGTPLLSPTYSTTTPQKRRSTDFYSLLKSPKIAGTDGLKRRSMELNAIINVDGEDEVLSSSVGSSPRRKNTVEIKRISENLRTRLNYANLKIQHGWSDKSVEELQKKLEDDKKHRVLTAEEKSKYDDFWKLGGDELPKYEPPKTPKSPVSPRHRRRGSAASTNSRFSLDEVANKGSAERALYKALSPRRTPQRPQVRTTTSPSPENRLEHDAIVSLMSLSSPVKYSQSASPSPSHESSRTSEHVSPLRNKPPLAPPKFEPGTIGAAAVAAADETEETEDETEDEAGDATLQGLGLKSSTTGQPLGLGDSTESD